MDPQLIGLAGLFITVAGGGAGVVWKITRVEGNIRDKIDAETAALDGKLAKVHERLAALERQQLEEMAMLRREAGESIAAIRTKVHEIETWARDEFVRKGSFEIVVARMEKGHRNPRREDRAPARQDGRADRENHPRQIGPPSMANRYLALAIVSVLSMIVLLFSVASRLRATSASGKPQIQPSANGTNP